MKHLLGVLSVAFVAAGWATDSQAIPVSYGQTTHDTTDWQELANVPAGDQYGVSWSVNNGLTWGHEDLYVGQTVQFKFNMHKDNVGTHYADLIKAWVDWGQDGTFNSTEKIFYAEHLLSTEPVLGSGQTPATPDLEYFSQKYQLTQANVGELWLRALVTCSHSILVNTAYGADWNMQWDPQFTQHYDELLAPVGHYYQGETEEWKLVVHSVPEPSTITLLGAGFALFSAARRRGKKSAS